MTTEFTPDGFDRLRLEMLADTVARRDARIKELEIDVNFKDALIKLLECRIQRLVAARDRPPVYLSGRPCNCKPGFPHDPDCAAWGR